MSFRDNTNEASPSISPVFLFVKLNTPVSMCCADRVVDLRLRGKPGNMLGSWQLRQSNNLNKGCFLNPQFARCTTTIFYLLFICTLTIRCHAVERQILCTSGIDCTLSSAVCSAVATTAWPRVRALALVGDGGQRCLSFPQDLHMNSGE